MLQLKDVSKRFNLTGKKDDYRSALEHINLTIESGEFVTIIGGNGSGKSTSMNIITGVLKPDFGQVLLNGVDITRKSEHQRAKFFGRVFQDPMMGTAGDMSVIENLEMAYRRGKIHSPIKWGFSKKHRKEFIEALKRFDLGLETRLNQKVGVMSGGQRQALTLLMATMKAKPTYKQIRKDYIKFGGENKDELLSSFDTAYIVAKRKYQKERKNIKSNKSLDKKTKKELLKSAFVEMDQKIRKFDLTKQILLLDEHTAALDPKTAKKVLNLTEKIVKENKMTTLMVTHNMKDAITYGDRLIMYHSGHIILDIKGEDKQKLTVDDLLRIFDEADRLLEKK